MADVLVVGSKVKEAVKKSKMNSSGDLIPALSSEVERLLKRAVKRCQDNGRKTVRACDL